jgi:branched-subunit amino acid aminotransferase/4-amino-4-deoxychorismate lyase
MEQQNYIWLNNQIVTHQDAQVDVLSFTLHYGYGFFEGLL